MSRGCWWGKKTIPEQAKGCAFYNLNLQWKGHRSKSLPKVVREIDSMTDRFDLLSVSFMDNLLPPKNLQSLFETLATLGKDFRFFWRFEPPRALPESRRHESSVARVFQADLLLLRKKPLPVRDR
jgi:hypothetical protein